MILRAILVVTATVGATLLMRSVLHRFIAAHRIVEAEALGDMIMQALAGLYGVLVAFILAGAWDRLATIRGTFAAELNALSQLEYFASQIPPPQRTQLVAAIDAYRRRIVSEMSAVPGTGRRATPGLPDIAPEGATIVNLTAAFEPRTPAQARLQSIALQTIREILVQRPRRLQRSTPLPPIVWIVLLAGAVTVLTLAAISSRTPLGAVYLTFLAVLISLALVSIHALSCPVCYGLV